MKKLFLALTLFASVSSLFAQNSNGKSNTVNTTVKNIEQKIKDVVSKPSLNATRLLTADKNIQSWVDNNWINGGVGLLMRNGKIEYYQFLIDLYIDYS